MSKTTAPLLSFEARGQIGQSQVYSSWKGRSYARRYVVPANPQSAEQTKTRSLFTWLQAVYKVLPSTVKAGWDAYANTLRVTGANAWIKGNLSHMRGMVDLSALLMSPAANSGLPVATMTATPGSTSITVMITPPLLPDGWTVKGAFAAAIIDQNPQTDNMTTVTAGTDDTNPYSITLTGLTAGKEYRVGGWMTYTKPDGSTAYGQATMMTATPTA